MATHAFMTSTMQSLNSNTVVQQASNGQGNAGQKTVSLTNHSGATIIQPSQGHCGQQFIVTISGDGNSENSHALQEVHTLQEVQIQQGTPSQVIYQSAHPQNYSDYGQFNNLSGAYYHTAGSGSQMNLGGQVLAQGGTYLVQGSMDGDGHPITHTTRASPATGDMSSQQRGSHFDVKSWQREVQWLIDNYETAEGVSLPRSTLYNHYLRHCQEQKIDPMNPASFGKLIRSVFLGLRTRRLGTRGNSKYHYYGIRIKPSSPLNAFTDDHALPMRQQPMTTRKFKSSPGGVHEVEVGSGGNNVNSAENTQQHQHQQFLGDASGAIPVFGHIELGVKETLPDGITLENLRSFEDLYKKHCEHILNVVVNLQFSEIERLWQRFWRTCPSEFKQHSDYVAEQRLPVDKLYSMCRLPAVQKFVRRADYVFYQAIVEVLIPDVLRPIPSSLTQAVRNFAKSLEGWLKGALIGVPDEMVKTKVKAVGAFAQTLRRYTSLNHLAQAARAVLQNTTQITQMLADLNRVDFTNVQEQASWVCECEDTVVHQLEQDFKATLQAQNSLEQWASWLENVVNHVLQPFENSPNFAKAARQFLLKWSFYSSMVIRDLTLRSAASFGSFHLIRLLYDEYMFYLVEHKVAAAVEESPIAVMGEYVDSNPGTSTIAPMSVLNTDDKAATQALLRATAAAGHGGTQAIVIKSNPSLVHLNYGGIQYSTPLVQISGSPARAHVNSIGAATTMAVVASGGGGSAGTKTIVVVPVSAAAAGDAQPPMKKLKTQVQ